MSMNFTIDDTSSSIIYSSNWALQPSNDPGVNNFFQSSYHSAQADGATANLTFSGSAVYIYGTKGPGHSNYSIQFDNFVIFYSANTSTVQYQQPLFSFTFNTTGSHFVSLRSHFVDGGDWLDLDYITVTGNDTSGLVAGDSTSNSPVPSRSQSIFPPWLASSATFTPSIQPSGSSESSSTPSSPASSTAGLARTTLILSIGFGAIIIAALVVFLVMFCKRRNRKAAKRATTTSSTRHIREISRGEKHVGFAYGAQPSPTTISGFETPPHSPGLMPPEVYRPMSRSTGTSSLPRDLLSPTSAVGTFTIPGLHDRNSPHPLSPWSEVSTIHSEGALSHSRLLPAHASAAMSDRKSHQHHTPSSSLGASTVLMHSRSQSECQPQTAPLVPQPHPDFQHLQQAPASPGLPPQSNLYRPPPSEPLPPIPSSGLPSPVSPGFPTINSQARLAPNRNEGIPLITSAAINVDPNTFLIPARRPPRPPPPRRPQRPKNGGLLDWFGGLERAREGTKDKYDDGNSQRTNFLKMF